VSANWHAVTAWLVLPALAVGTIFDLVRGITFHLSIQASGTGLLFGLFLAGATLEVTFFMAAVRRVRVDLSGVQFWVGFRRLVVAWSELVPPTIPLFVGINFRYKRAGVVQDRPPLFVTKRQAQAILESPHCPHFRLDAAIWQSLDLPPHGR
jgi:hypothetical protein